MSNYIKSARWSGAETKLLTDRRTDSYNLRIRSSFFVIKNSLKNLRYFNLLNRSTDLYETWHECNSTAQDPVYHP
jgi:hypothetical protein